MFEHAGRPRAAPFGRHEFSWIEYLSVDYEPSTRDHELSMEASSSVILARLGTLNMKPRLDMADVNDLPGEETIRTIEARIHP